MTKNSLSVCVRVKGQNSVSNDKVRHIEQSARNICFLQAHSVYTLSKKRKCAQYTMKFTNRLCPTQSYSFLCVINVPLCFRRND